MSDAVGARAEMTLLTFLTAGEHLDMRQRGAETMRFKDLLEAEGPGRLGLQIARNDSPRDPRRAPRTHPGRWPAWGSFERSFQIHHVSQSRIAAAISGVCVSSAKWPVSRKRTTAAGIS